MKHVNDRFNTQHKERGAGQSSLYSYMYVMLPPVSLPGSCSSRNFYFHPWRPYSVNISSKITLALSSPTSMKAHSTSFFIFNHSLSYIMCWFFPVLVLPTEEGRKLLKREAQFLFISCNYHSNWHCAENRVDAK